MTWRQSNTSHSSNFNFNFVIERQSNIDINAHYAWHIDSFPLAAYDLAIRCVHQRENPDNDSYKHWYNNCIHWRPVGMHSDSVNIWGFWSWPIWSPLFQIITYQDLYSRNVQIFHWKVFTLFSFMSSICPWEMWEIAWSHFLV